MRPTPLLSLFFLALFAALVLGCDSEDKSQEDSSADLQELSDQNQTQDADDLTGADQGLIDLAPQDTDLHIDQEETIESDQVATDTESDEALDHLSTDSEDLSSDQSADSEISDAPTEEIEELFVYTETEPNNGATATEFNEVEAEWLVEAEIGSPGDVDIFRLDIPGGQRLQLELTPLTGSQLSGHLTVFDTGRNGKVAGDDFIKIMRQGDDDTLPMDFVSMGEGGYYLVVQDGRNADGASVGGADFGYTLSIRSEDLAESFDQYLSLPSSFDDLLEHRGGVKVYSFEATEGMDLVADLQAQNSTAPEGLDARLFLVSVSSGDWVARNDDRALDNDNPLIDAPVFASGQVVIVVDNIAERASQLQYHLTVY